MIHFTMKKMLEEIHSKMKNEISRKTSVKRTRYVYGWILSADARIYIRRKIKKMKKEKIDYGYQ